MKRIGLLILLVIVVSGAAFAQVGADISGLGADFENLVEELGEEMLPNIQQLAGWGQFPGQAALPADSRLFFTLSAGTVLGFDGILGFVDDNSAFELLNIEALFDAILTGSAAAADAIGFVQGFFPYPVARSALGFRLPGDLEAMVDFAIFPQFLANTATNLVEAVPEFELNTLHVGSRIRKVLLRDAPGVPAMSIGAGYSYTGFNIGYDFGSIGAIDTALGEINFSGELYLQSRVHSFGLDFQVSKNLGFFVPFIGLSPHYQLSGYTGGVGTTEKPFDAWVDFGPDDPDPLDPRDIEYSGDAPATTLSDNDLTLVLFGGFDLVFDRLALQVHGSYNVGETWPAISIGSRFQ
jgi:hypothetical protein